MGADSTQEGTILLGKYELIERAGAGGMATVWRAVCHGEAGFQLPVAVKRMLPSLAVSEEFAAMFVEEARVVSALTHPNVVRVHDFCRDEQHQFFIVMEWVEGLDLGHWILAHARRRELTPWPVVAMMAIDVLRALAAAHGRRDGRGRPAPTFHRDVTPSNVLMSIYGEVKLADFGLARAMDRITLTTPGVVKGKLAYVAPEMVAGERASVGSDLYSLGVVLWEALAGRRLFEGKNDVELFVRVGRGDVPPIEAERPDIPRTLVAVLKHLLAKNPDDRFLVAEEAADAFRAVLRDEGLGFDSTQVAKSVENMRRIA